jgi:hypothetical protein
MTILMVMEEHRFSAMEHSNSAADYRFFKSESDFIRLPTNYFEYFVENQMESMAMAKGLSTCCPLPKPALQAATVPATAVEMTLMTLMPEATEATAPLAAKVAAVDSITLNYHRACSVTLNVVLYENN